MAQTQAQVDAADDEFANAYKEDPKAPPAQSDDDAFGLNLDAVVQAEDDGIPNNPEEATEAEPDAPEAVNAETEPAAQANEAVLTPADLAREVQRLKSWEGRLKARESEQRAGETVAASTEGAPTDPGANGTEPSIEKVAEAEIQKLQGLSPEDALQTLAADFGDEFTNLLNAIIDAKVSKAVHGMNQSVDEIINDIQDSKARHHFETVVTRHPDFNDIADSEDFKAFIEALPDQDKAEANRIVEVGSAAEICKLLDVYKGQKKSAPAEVPTAAAATPAQEDTEGMDAAEGVRSTGMRLPTQPAASTDYGAAWDEFAD